jgi:hypothetical protein
VFVSEDLKTHLQESATIKLKSLIVAEWNMNMPDNIFKLGNYRHRPTDNSSIYFNVPNNFDNLDVGNFYTGATDADVTIDGGFTDNDTPQQFISKKEKLKLIYSLEDCLNPFRPRSGINKASYFNNKFLSNSGEFMGQRPRYYMPSRYDQFKYWTSYRTENNVEHGIANINSNGRYFINDAAPFVVYKDDVPTNKIVIKMQTNIGDVDLGIFNTKTGSVSDPFYGNTNKTTPSDWKIQYLQDNRWVDAYSFKQGDLRESGDPIIGSDGYVELEYGLKIPEQYKSFFIFIDTISSSVLLPDTNLEGYAYLVVENSSDRGTFYIWTNGGYSTFLPEYGWQLGSETINRNTNFINDLTSPDFFIDNVQGQNVYRNFVYIKGIRIVVDTMNKYESTFDLIEMSPRLVVDISNKVIDFKITKTLSDIGTTSLPVGQLLASNGELSLFDDDQAFNDQNETSIIYKYIRKNIKFTFYETVLDVLDQDFLSQDYYIPIKTLYSEGFPQANVTAGTLSLQLRDLFFFLESMPAPRLLTTEASLSYSVATLLDYIGFSNYVFKRIDEKSEMVIPFFFIAPDQNVAEVLNQLAIATQTAMFFDEYNNLVIMSKDYLMPETVEDRGTDFVLSGSNSQTETGIYKNLPSTTLPNIISIASEDKKIYNDGKINYTTRYIQRSYGSIRQSNMIDKDKTWIYKPSLLWEVSGTETTKTINEIPSNQSNYSLSAMPLNFNLSDTVPTVVNNKIINNIMDFGENIYWLSRFQGYFYSNGEIIKYDAVEFNITGTGNVFISSNQEYQKYFSSLPFNGKIYPTGIVRIYATPYYQTVNGISRLQTGSVVEHGRGQFGTTITSHEAGLPQYWLNNENIHGIDMRSEFLFTTTLDSDISYPATTVGAAGINNALAKQTTRNSIIKNFMSTNFLTETEVNDLGSTKPGTIQSSALVMTGPPFKTTETPLNFVSYIYKNLDNAYKHFGTRIRIIGKLENNENKTQTPVGSVSYYQISGVQPDQNVTIGGGSGGLGILVNPETNNGYYFEIVALTEENVNSYLKIDEKGNAEKSINNVVFYKIKKDAANNNAIPIKLWGGLAKITVDDGNFVGQKRLASEETSTVYDLSVEYQDIGKTRRFYLYINNKLIQVVDDSDPLPVYNNMALFTRGSSKCMFENIYALSKNYSQNTVATISPEINNAFGQTENLNSFNKETGLFGENEINLNESFRKYAISGVVQSTYLSGISAQEPPKYNMYFEEFGSIMRECAYFDVKYDRAYPALYAQLSPTFNRVKGYTTSGFLADSYGAEFLIFNATDAILNLDETSGNYLRIQGVTFTQDTTRQLTVDEYFKKRGNFSDPELKGDTLIVSPVIEKAKYDEIKQSRMIYGKNEFSIDSIYIQSDDDAEKLMGWVIDKTMKPRKSVGVNIFAIPTLQLGDIVTIDYKDSSELDLVASSLSRFVIYNIEYSRNNNGPNMTIYLSEV